MKTQTFALIIALVFLPACSLFNGGEPKPDELVQLTQEVLKRNEGVDIQVKPIPKEVLR